MKNIIRHIIKSLGGTWIYEPCPSCEESYYRTHWDEEGRTGRDINYCELPLGHYGKHKAYDTGFCCYQMWSKDRRVIKNEYVKDGIVYYHLKDYWEEVFPK